MIGDKMTLSRHYDGLLGLIRYVAEAACALENILKGEMDTAEIHLATVRMIDSLTEKLEASNA